MTLLGDPATDTDARRRRARIAGPLAVTVCVIGLIAWLGRLSLFEALLAMAIIGSAVLWSTRSAARNVLTDAAARAMPPVQQASTLSAFVAALPGPALILDASGTILAAQHAVA